MRRSLPKASLDLRAAISGCEKFGSIRVVNIRHATFDDIPRLLELERLAAEAAHWTKQHYCEALTPDGGQPERLFLIVEGFAGEDADQRGAIIAFLVARHLASEWELENIVVAANSRRKGIAVQLLNFLLEYALETHSTSVFLEVRESNTAARSLYERFGFQESGRRKSYYGNPQEDAIVYGLSWV